MNDNPWHRLPDRPPYVLPDDEAAVRAFNAQASDNHRLRIDEILPEPFVGAPNARVLLLGNNPGFNPKRVQYKMEPAFVRRLRDNLLHQASDYPFVFFAEDIHESHKDWWKRKLKELLRLFGLGDLARSILAVEHFPYPSRRYGGGLPQLSSQEFSFLLVRKAMERKAVIVVTRGERRWRNAVPKLFSYDRLCMVRNPQAGSISRRNCERFDEVVRAIKEGLA
jgi:hypothetical protein